MPSLRPPPQLTGHRPGVFTLSQRIYRLAAEGDLASPERRQILIRSLPGQTALELPHHARPLDQLLSDVNTLCALYPTDPEPLTVWLATATNMTRATLMGQALQAILDELLSEHEKAVDTTFVMPTKPVVHQVHETTWDGRFVGRRSEVAMLDDSVASTDTKFVGIMGLGGIGKTALIGRWIDGIETRLPGTVAGVFFWSCYVDIRFDALAREFLQFATEQLGIPVEGIATGMSQLREILDNYPLLLVLDGMEVLQETDENMGRGRLLDSAYRELFYIVRRQESQSTLVCTSRFPFPDMRPHVGGSARLVELASLPSVEGSQLLRSYGLSGTNQELEKVSHHFAGHPLALRIVALVIQRQTQGDVSRFWHAKLSEDALNPERQLEGKLGRILHFYDETLTHAQRQLLALLATFPDRASERTLVGLARAATWEGQTPESSHSIMLELEALADDGLLLRSVMGTMPYYACHPVLRDYFKRRVADGAAASAGIRVILSDRPETTAADDYESLEEVCNCVIALAELGSITEAEDVFRVRLREGKLLESLGNYRLGLKVAIGVVSSILNRRVRGESRQPFRLSFWFGLLGHFAGLAAEPELGRKHLLQALDETESPDVVVSFARCLYLMGDLKKAAATTAQMMPRILSRISHGRGFQDYQALVDAHTEALYSMGWSHTADVLLEAVGQATMKNSIWDLERIPWIRFTGMLRREQYGAVLREVSYIRTVATDARASACDVLTGVSLAYSGQSDRSLSVLQHALDFFGPRQGCIFMPLIFEGLAMAHFHNGDLRHALYHAEQSLDYARARGLVLSVVDGLALSGRLFLDWPTGKVKPTSVSPQEGLEAAVALARRTGYLLGQIACTRLLTRAYREAGDTQAADVANNRLDQLHAVLAHRTVEHPEDFGERLLVHV